jgi:hypothetical protein
MSLEIHSETLKTTCAWERDELVFLCGGHATYKLLLDDNELYYRRKTAWHCPCPGQATLDNKRDLAIALAASGMTREALMLPTVTITHRDDVPSYPAILKPFNGGCGEGIRLAEGASDLPVEFSTMVCTSLITDCLLYNGTHKADLRMFAIMHPHTRRVLLYRDALVRCSQTPYSQGTFGALVTNTSVQMGCECKEAPPVMSRFFAYVPGAEYRSRVYAELLVALVAVARSVFEGRRVRERGFLMVGFDVLLSADPKAPPTVLEYNVGWDRSEDGEACAHVKHNAVQQLVKALVSGKPQADVSVASW